MTECAFHGCHDETVDDGEFCRQHLADLNGTCDKLPTIPEPATHTRQLVADYFDLILSR